jgi:uncharacterized membrane protein
MEGHMTRKRTLHLLALNFALGAASNILADSPTFTQIDFPGAASTQAWGFTANGDMVGNYVSANNSTHGFLRTRGEFISIDFPGAAYTQVNGMSPRGDIFGQYAATLNGSGPNHGFVLSRDGVFTTVDFPGAASSNANGMNSRGDVVGTYTLADNLRHTFVMNADPFSPGGQFKAIDDPPGASFAGPIGMRGDDIVGAYFSGGPVHGFLLADGTYTTIDVPGASYTNATGSNASGQVVGRYTLDGVTHGYLLSGGQITSYDFPGATFTGATAISANGDILGRFQDAKMVFHGFLLTGFRPANACAAGN